MQTGSNLEFSRGGRIFIKFLNNLEFFNNLDFFNNLSFQSN